MSWGDAWGTRTWGGGAQAGATLTFGLLSGESDITFDVTADLGADVAMSGEVDITTQIYDMGPAFEARLSTPDPSFPTGMHLKIRTSALLVRGVPPIPAPVEGNWTVICAEDCPNGQIYMKVDPLTCSIPTGALLYFTTARVKLTSAANQFDTIIHIDPVLDVVSDDDVGTGSYRWDGTGGSPSAPHGPMASDPFPFYQRVSIRMRRPVLDLDGKPH